MSDHAPIVIPDRLRWRGLAVMLAGAFLPALDFNIVNVSIPEIRQGIHASFADIQLIISGYGLAYAVALITGGRLGDIFGRRRIFVLGIGLFGIASALCALAPSPAFLIGARALQGLAGAVMFPQALSFIQATFSGEERSQAFAIFGVALGLGSICGNLVGGVLTEANLFGLGWRPIFWINLPVVVVAVLLSRIWVRDKEARIVQKLDLGGAALVAVSLGLLLYPMIVGREVRWAAWTWMSFAASIVFMATFLRFEWSKTVRRDFPLIDMRLFRHRQFSAGLVVGYTFWWGLSAILLILTVFIQLALYLRPAATGFMFVPFAGAFLATSIYSARIVDKLGRSIVQLGTSLMMIGILWMVGLVWRMGATVPPLWLVPGIAIYGAGQGFTQSPLISLILSGVADSEAGSASGVLLTVQQVAYAAGVASIGSIYFGLAGELPGPVSYARAFSLSLLINFSLAALAFVLVQLLPRQVSTVAMVVAE